MDSRRGGQCSPDGLYITVGAGREGGREGDDDAVDEERTGDQRV